jgi:hypothetical protein
MRTLIEKDKLVDGVWTAYSSALDRSALKKGKFLESEPGSTEPIAAEATARAAAEPAPERPAGPTSPFAAKLISALRNDG